ncbi:ATP-grasp domain-containing protein [Planotetraspora sp. GP83]|uniref:ATP-grasp domain-containing protein n=1 Tax=Planotetraspora sp. GP83 TaxID=3156264 RepID=UPI0035118D6D
MTVGFLFCADPLRPRRGDPHFGAQTRAVRDLGGRLALIDHDAIVAGRIDEAVAGVPLGFGPAWYRGWMLRAEQYEAMEEALLGRGCRLLTSGREYRAGHELPGWIDCFREFTPETVVVPMAPGAPCPDVTRAAAGLGDGGFVIKDYVKSRKHEWLDACYAADLARLRGVVAKFVERQGEDLVGGLVIRRFEDLEDGQVRVWWVDGKPVFAGPHPDTPEADVESPHDLSDVRAAVRRLGCRFVTTDLVRRTDGVWRVIEVGDGQVSDWPRHADPAVLYAALLEGAVTAP